MERLFTLGAHEMLWKKNQKQEVTDTAVFLTSTIQKEDTLLAFWFYLFVVVVVVAYSVTTTFKFLTQRDRHVVARRL